MTNDSRAKWQYAGSDQQAVGPFATEDMPKLCSAGIINDQTLVRPVNGTEWKPFGTVWPPEPPPATAGRPGAPSKSWWAEPANLFALVCLFLFSGLLAYHLQSVRKPVAEIPAAAEPATPQPTETAESLEKPTERSKTALRKRILQLFPPQPNGHISAARAQFISSIGEPNRTQAREEIIYWYYDCADGQVQLMLYADALNRKGMLNGSVYEY